MTTLQSDGPAKTDAKGVIAGDRSSREPGRHLVQFYETDAVLEDSVARFAAAGLAGGETVVLVVTSEHRAKIRERLAAGAFDFERAIANEQLVVLDARATLAELKDGAGIDAARFGSVMGDIVERARARRRGVVRVYGEMVDLACRQGEHPLALELERLWDELLATKPIYVLCGYSLASFRDGARSEEFLRVCRAHRSESPIDTSEGSPTTIDELSLLAQRARGLEAEVEHRRSLERALREREAELRDFLDNASEGIHLVGADGKILWANRAELALLGYAPEEYFGHHISEFHLDADAIGTILERLTRGEELRGIEARMRAKDGSVRHVLLSSNVYRRDGEFVHTRCFTRDITDRKRAEAERAASAGTLQAVLEQMPSAVAIVEAPSGRLLLANEQNASIFRQPNVPLDGVPAYSRFHGLHADGREIAPEEWPLARSIATGEVIRGEEIHVVRGDGTHGHIRASSSPIRDASGAITAGVVTFDDVTEQAHQRRVTETLLRVSTMLNAELDLDSLMQRLTDEATTLCRAEFGSFFYNVTNDAGESYMLYTLSGVPREAFSKFPMPRNTAIFAPTFAGDGVVRLDDVKKDPRYGKNSPHHGMPKGHLPVSSYLAVPVKTRAGEVLGGLFFGHSQVGVFTAEDENLLVAISAHAAVAIENARAYQAVRRAEQKAQVERARLHELFMHAPASIWIMRGEEHVIEFVNAGAKTLFPGRELVGKPIAEAIPDRDAKRMPMLDQAFKTGRTQHVSELSAAFDWKGDGNVVERFFDVTYEPLRDETGTVVGVMTFSFDVTDKVLARRRVELIVNELESASRMKDEFLATVSHELRTPLNAILGWTRMLQSGTLPESRRKKALETIERNANAQTQLIEDLLDVSRIISGKMRLEIRTVDLPRVVADAIEAVRPAATAKGVTITETIDPLASPMLGDGDRLQQIVWNLLSNAVKFTPKGGRVHVVVRKRDSLLELIVADNGAGIDAAFLPFVFERFRQADATTSRKHMGLGLGLAIVRHLVELHGGQVQVESEGAGHGATFTVCLPVSPLRSKTVEQAPVIRDSGSVVSLVYPPELAGIHVLVVEDDADARDLLVDVLEPLPARVTAVGNVQDALAAIAETRPDVIVSDIGLPGEDGYAFIRRLRALPPSEGGRIPAVALTAYARLEDRMKALVAGFNMHIPKPVEPAELMTVLASLATLFAK